MNCLERKQHTVSWWSCKMASIPLRTSHVPAPVNEWTHTETLLKYKNVNRTNFSLFVQLVWQFWGYHSPYLCFTSPATPNRALALASASHSVPMLLTQNMRPLCLDQVGQDSFQNALFKRSPQQKHSGSLYEPLNSFKLLLDIRLFNSIIWGQLQCASFVLIKGIFQWLTFWKYRKTDWI